MRPERINVGNIEYQPAPLGSGIASFEIENRALSLFRAERREIRVFTAVK